MIYDNDFRKYFSKVQIFSFNDAKRFLTRMGASDAYIKVFVHNQIKRHGLRKVGKGKYTFSSNDAIIGFAFSPFYYGLECALTIRKLWTQMSNLVIVTTTKAVPGIRSSMGSRIIIRRISKRMFFGIEWVNYNGVFVPVSDPEKTLVDFFYYRIGLNDEDLRSLMLACDKKKLARYARRSNNRVKLAIAKVFER
ncbi:MAG: hypothetical protein M1354_02485 [Candidatus Marsarchaeota archaeon]|jgi:predicted transcriptional regulator of viral defense system|nr:hypothetical protein [Candidatus Marsarchaeota archaeon]